MTRHIALLRAINVGGTGKLAMKDLRALCGRLGFESAETYIQSGNVIFDSKLEEAEVKTKLERALAREMGRPVKVLVRGVRELSRALSKSPFIESAPKRVLVFFFDEAPSKALIGAVRPPGNEELVVRGRELFIHFPDGMGKSRLKIPQAELGTGRNLNTLRKLVELAEARSRSLGPVERPPNSARR